MGQRTSSSLLYTLYGMGLSLLFACIFTAQVLSFANLYTPLFAIGGTALVTILAAYAYLRHDHHWFKQAMQPPADETTTIRHAIVLLVVIFTGVLFVYRMTLWPQSQLGAVIAGDTLSYHFVKAIELYRTGSLWDISFAYAQYPIGYEALGALALMLTGSLTAIGVFHALIHLLLFMTLYFLFRRYTGLSVGLCLLATLAITLFPPLHSMLLIVGKNDILLSLTLLIAILHAPLGHAPRAWHPYGLAFATLISLSVKASGFIVLLYLWLLVLYRWWQAYRAGYARSYLHPATFALLIAIMFPCGLWVIRNLIMMGNVFSPEVSLMFGGSIAANLSNAALYTSGAESMWLLIIAAITMSAIIGTAFVGYYTQQTSLDLWTSGLIALMWLAFVITPLGAFHTSQSPAPHIEWRYTPHLFMFLFVVGLALLQPLILPLYQRINAQSVLRWAAIAALAIGGVGLAIVIDLREALTLNPDHQRILQTPYEVAVGRDGYASGYDYVQQNLHDVVIYYNVAERYYLYGDNYSNTFTPGYFYPLGNPDAVTPPVPDYAAFIGYTPQHLQFMSFAPLRADYAWQLIYDDDVSRIYRRTP